MKRIILSKQLSIYLILASMIITAAMMRPGFSTLAIALPINAMVLFLLRWVAHREGQTIDAIQH